MKKVEWPKDNKPANFEDLSKSVREVVKHCYTLSRKNKKKDVEWKGPSLPKCMRASCLTFENTLKVEGLDYNLNDQGRDAMEVIIGIAIQLGIEQGRRMMKDEMKPLLQILESKVVDLSATIRELKDIK